MSLFFVKVMSNFGEKMTDGQIEEMVREADLDRDGKISYAGRPIISRSL